MSKETQIIQKLPFVDLLRNNESILQEAKTPLETDIFSHGVGESKCDILDSTRLSALFSDSQNTRDDTKIDYENNSIHTSVTHTNAENVIIQDVQKSPKKSKHMVDTIFAHNSGIDDNEIDSEDDLVRTSYFDSHRKSRSTSPSSVGSKVSQSSPMTKGIANMALTQNFSDDGKYNDFSLLGLDETDRLKVLAEQRDNLVGIYIQHREKYQGFVQTWNKLRESCGIQLNKLELREDDDIETYFTQAVDDYSLKLWHDLIIDMMLDMHMQLFTLKLSLPPLRDDIRNKFVNVIDEWVDDVLHEKTTACINLAIFHTKHECFKDAMCALDKNAYPDDDSKSLRKALDILLEIQEMWGDKGKVNDLASSIDNYRSQEYFQELCDAWKNSLPHYVDRKYKDKLSIDLMRSGHNFEKLFFDALSEMSYVSIKDYDSTLHKHKENLIHAAKNMLEYPHNTTVFKNYLSDFVDSGHVGYVIPYKALVEIEHIDWTMDKGSNGGGGAGRFMYTALSHLGSVDDMWNEVELGGQTC